jgi:hypothetical protein
VFASASHFHPSLVFVGKAGGYQSGPPYRAQLKCLAPSLAPIYYIRVEVDDMANTLAYYDTAKITPVKSFKWRQQYFDQNYNGLILPNFYCSFEKTKNIGTALSHLLFRWVWIREWPEAFLVNKLSDLGAALGWIECVTIIALKLVKLCYVG